MSNQNITSSRPWQIVAQREVMTKLRDKSFIFGTLFSLALIIISIGASVFFGNRTTDYTVAVLDSSAQTIVEAAQSSQGEDDDTLHAQRFSSEGEARESLKNDDVDALLTTTNDGWKLTYQQSPSQQLTQILQQSIVATITAQNATQMGVNLERLSACTQLETQSIEGNDNAMIATLVGMGFALIFYMATLIFGQLIAQSVVEEKQNRIVEIIATAIPISQLLAGKIIGNIVLAIGQVAVYAIVGLGGLTLTGQTSEYGWILSSTGWFVAFYVVGFAAIATMWAGVGAMASRVEDVGNLSMPLMMVLIGALFAGIYAGDQILMVLSFVPVISSTAMPMRLLVEDVPVWQPLLALVLGLLATWLLTLLGARIYRNNIMRGGSAVSWKQALRQK